MKIKYFLVFISLLINIVNAQNIQFEQVIPPPPAPQNDANFDAVRAGTIAFADIDNDNDQDVLITGTNNLNQNIAKLYNNDGAGNFAEITGTPFSGGIAGAFAFADVDNDNDQDVIITGTSSDSSKLYTNDGSGNFTLVNGTPFPRLSSGSIVFADIDDDNDQDVLITGEDFSGQGRAKLYSNDGNGNFTLISGTPFDGVWNSSTAFTDIDNDNDQDVLITGMSKSGVIAKLYVNDGSGNFFEDTETPFDGVWYGSIAFADVDNDNDQDVFIAGATSSSPWEPIAKLFINDGNGKFSEVSGAPFEGVWSSSIAFSDIDNDEDQDLLISGPGNFSKLYINDGAGNYTLISGTPFEGVWQSSIAFADIDNDSDQDVLITGQNSFYIKTAKLYINYGDGNFLEVKRTPFDGVWAGSIAFADIDNDNDQDVLITGQVSLGDPESGISKLYVNDGDGGYTLISETPFDDVQRSSVAFGDIDNDNDQDVLIAGKSGSDMITKLYTNDGVGNFEEVIDTPFIGVQDGSINIADIDNDDDQDILITGENYSGRYTKLYINDGSGNFEEVMDTPFIGVHKGSIAFTDIDNDNDQDLLITGVTESIAGPPPYNPRTKLYTNDGSGNFEEVISTPFEGVWKSSIAFADIDNDNDQDLLITGENNNIERIAKLYLNDGSGNYTLITGTPFEGVQQGSIAFADVDNDNDQDVINTGLSGYWPSEVPMTKLYSNDGSGHFTRVTEINFGQFHHSSSVFFDIDNDEKKDLLITGLSGGKPSARLYRNITTQVKVVEEKTVINEVNIYPNPNKGVVNIEIGNLKNVSIKVFNIKGQLIYHEENINAAIHQFNFNEPSGIYFIELFSGLNKQNYKFIKK